MAPLTSLQVIGIRYRGTRPDLSDERCLDAYVQAGVYNSAGIPVQNSEPKFPEAQRTDDEPINLGLLSGVVADTIGQARKANKAVVMTGGDCTHITGMLGGLQQALGAAAKIGLIWLDAHGDINTPQSTLTGSYGGMPVAVCAGLAFPTWREGSAIQAPLPMDRILMVDVRNLDPAEQSLLDFAGVPVAAPASGFPGTNVQAAIDDLAERVDHIYLHVDSDILDATLVPNHGTREPNGPDLAQVQQIIAAVMQTGKVSGYAVVSVYGGEPGRDVSVQSGIGLIGSGLRAWAQAGQPEAPV